MYSLVTPSVLVTDVACRTAGGHLLGLLEEVLLLDRAALPALCDALLRSDLDAGVAARRAAAEAEVAAPTHDSVLLQLQAAAAPGGPGRGRPDVDGAAARLARLPAGGGLPALRALVAEQALPAVDRALPTLDEQAAQSVAGDALTEGWHADLLAREHREALRGPWASARRSAPRWLRSRAGALGPQADAVRATCARVRQQEPEVLDGLAAAHGRSDGWPAQMHQAAEAAHRSDRVRAVACAQVQVAGALLAAAGPQPDPVRLRCALPPLLGAVTSAALQDVLADEVAAALSAVWSSLDAG